MTTARDEILELLTEDYYGPCELVIQVPVERDLLHSAITTLLEDAYVEWFTRADDSAEAVPLAEVGLDPPDLSDDAVWTTPSLDTRQWLLGVTEKGERAYFGTGASAEKGRDER